MTVTTVPSRANGIASRLSAIGSTSAMGNTGLAPDAPVPALALDFTVGSLDPRITFSRAYVSGTNHAGTYFDSAGVLREAKVNLLTYSDAFNDASWTSGAIALTQTANTLTPTSASSVHSCRHTVTLVGGTFQVKAKANGYSVIAISNNPDNWVYYNLSGAGSMSTLGTGFTAATITLQSDGYYLCTATSNSTWGICMIHVCNAMQASGNTAPPSYVGDTTSGVLVKNAQAETGSTASTYIPTTTAASAAPRFDYDNGIPRGLLIEEARANLETNSTAYVTSGVAMSTDGSLFLDGTAANLATFNGASTQHYFYRGTTTTSSGAYTLSIYLKAGTQTLAQLYAGAGGGVTVYCNYNLATGAMTAGAGIVASSNFCTPVGNGWFRCGFTYSTAGGTGACVGVVGISSISDSRLPTNTVSGTLYANAAQLELGSFPTSYIPTTTTSLTRAADSASMTGTNFSSWYNNTEGTILVNSDIGSTFAVAKYSLIFPTGTSISHRFDTLSRSMGGIGATTAASTGKAANTTVKSAISYNATNGAFTADGESVQSIASAPSSQTLVHIGNNAGSNYLNGHISRLVYFNKRLPDATLKALTL